MRWTLSEASVEFAIARKDLLKRLSIFGPADEEMTWGTRQIVLALYDDQYRRRSELLKQQSERFELNNAIKRGELVHVDQVKAFFRYAALTLRPLILAMAAPDNDKQRVFRALTELDAKVMAAEIKPAKITPAKRRKAS
jgi:phage terminase Nu1 subunit (DNA packaging protein)